MKSEKPAIAADLRVLVPERREPGCDLLERPGDHAERDRGQLEHLCHLLGEVRADVCQRLSLRECERDLPVAALRQIAELQQHVGGHPVLPAAAEVLELVAGEVGLTELQHRPGGDHALVICSASLFDGWP